MGWGNRVGFAIVGAFLIIYGYGENLRGKPLYTTWQGQTSTAHFVIFLGSVSLLVGVLPWPLLQYFYYWDPDRKKRRN